MKRNWDYNFILRYVEFHLLFFKSQVNEITRDSKYKTIG